MNKQVLDKWELMQVGGDYKIKAAVPGDITIDLYNAGKIKNPYFGLNYKENEWIAKSDFIYTVEFEVFEEVRAEESVSLVFEGIDLFAEIYLNGKKLDETKNMFLKYEYSVKELLKSGKNRLEVRMRSTLKEMEKLDCTGYFGVFNIPRLFLRKAQCHFGWDWAPDLPGYGIWGSVYLIGDSALRINDVSYVTDTQGNCTFFTELNYNIRSMTDFHGNQLKGTSIEKQKDTIVIYLADSPAGKNYVRKELEVTGKKNFISFKLEDAKLWWPIGYGEQPLYPYFVELYRNGKLISKKEGRLAFRTVELRNEPKTDTILGHSLVVNGEEIFVRGSNWVPIECFTGTVQDDKYEKLIKLAKNANINMLRVWGGGIYEKDIFYDICDELGIMVWQDFMFACSDLPENDQDWVDNTLKECEYQVRRLRNHPSLVYWCGGNEKTGTYGLVINKGDFFVDYILQGLVRTLDKTRPYVRQSPYSFTDVGNDSSSGETHHNSFERSLLGGIENYRNFVAEKIVPFISECAVFGPNSVETNEKIYPADKLFPLNEYWEDRLMDNPYAAVLMSFAKRQEFYVEQLYGKAKTLNEFTAKGMLVHAELLRTEIEFARSNKGVCSGILNWMYSDIWPSGTWAVVDYFLEPKQVYYQIKKSFAPVLVTFTQNGKSETELIVVNDRLDPLQTKVRFGAKTTEGKTVFENNAVVAVPANGIWKTVISENITDKDAYLFAEYEIEGRTEKTLYSPAMWKYNSFESDYTYQTEKLSENCVQVHIKARKFVKSLLLRFKNNFEYVYSDNYFDMEAGDEKVVIIEAEHTIDSAELLVTDYARMTGENK